MPTSSITHNFVISGEDKVEKFANAVEEACQDSINRTQTTDLKVTHLHDAEEIKKIYGEEKQMRPLGFLLPDGKLYSCKHYEHLDCAYRIVERSYTDFPLNSKLQAEQHLLSSGAIEIRKDELYMYDWCIINKEQLDFIKNYISTYKVNKDFKKSVNKLLFKMDN